jgi:competence protein ComEA
MHTIIRFITVALLVAANVALCADAIDINQANAEQLASAIDGVGEARAAAIVDYRTEHGPFRSVDELSLVQGIGQATVENNRDRLTVGSDM